jgi:hypothetical protein
MVTFGNRTTRRQVGKSTNVDEGIEKEPLTFFEDVAGAESSRPLEKLPTRRRTKPLVMIGAAIAIIVVVSLVVIGAGGPGSTDAAAQVMLGARTTLAKDTVKLTIHGSISDNGQSVPITGSGLADLSSNTESVSLAFDANYTAVQETVLVNGPSTYERIIENGHNLISRVLPGKAWMQGPENEAKAGGLGISSSNVLAQLQIFAQQGNSVIPLGPSTINGQAVAGYQVTLSQKSIHAAYQRLEAQGGASAAAVKTFLQNDGSISTPVIKLWMGTNHLLVSEEFDVSLSAGGTSVITEMTMDFSDYGLPVSISAPAPNEVTSLKVFEAATNHRSF